MGALQSLLGLLLLWPLCSLQAARILAIFPFAGPSQYINVRPYLMALAGRGHEVTSINAFPQRKPLKNFRDIPVLEVFDDYDDIITQVSVPMNLWEENNFINKFFVDTTRAVFLNKEVQETLLPPGKDHYDLIIVEALRSDAYYGFSAHFNAPLIGVSTFGTDWNIDELVGNTSPLSYTPLPTTGFTDRMTYPQRLANVLHTSLAWLNYNLLHRPRHEELYRKYLPEAAARVPLTALSRNFSLVLLNQHFSLSFARPYVPNMIEVGGLHIAHKPAPLPKDMDEFVRGSGEAGVIYFSLGSNVRSKDLPVETREKILRTFASLPQRVLWKFEDDQLPGRPSNVFIGKWFPQPDILAHPKVRLFITHGGLLSTIESIHHGKPVLGLPFFYDQFLNVERARQAGFGLGLDHRSMSQQEFQLTIQRLLEQPQFAERAQQMSARYRDQPMSPQETAIWWTEYVLRHKGAPHMRVAGQDLNFWAYHSIDVLGTLLAAALLLLILLVFLLWQLAKLAGLGHSKAKKQKKQ
ncbi:UDP-glycosyltransferase UGT5 [Drosophila obscura]|uniref:UDP-glycosyltransferase UGT5 n=1 Tax=Drosophila obscura TaxID=7282 RepID=UPI001BB133CB|nr:UDP-glycosyltransferase UGT5 [Drosophila obscura]